MTLQQLFRTADFDQAYAYITKFHLKSANSRFPFQVAFEWLCEVEPVSTVEEIVIKLIQECENRAKEELQLAKNILDDIKTL